MIYVTNDVGVLKLSENLNLAMKACSVIPVRGAVLCAQQLDGHSLPCELVTSEKNGAHSTASSDAL